MQSALTSREVPFDKVERRALGCPSVLRGLLRRDFAFRQRADERIIWRRQPKAQLRPRPKGRCIPCRTRARASMGAGPMHPAAPRRLAAAKTTAADWLAWRCACSRPRISCPVRRKPPSPGAIPSVPWRAKDDLETGPETPTGEIPVPVERASPPWEPIRLFRCVALGSGPRVPRFALEDLKTKKESRPSRDSSVTADGISRRSRRSAYSPPCHHSPSRRS
jgi:hypothetical protein